MYKYITDAWGASNGSWVKWASAVLFQLEMTSVATIAPPLVDSKHYNSFPFSPIWVDPLWESVRVVNQPMSTYKFYDNPPPIKLEYWQPSIGLIHCFRYNPGLPVFLMIPKFEMFITFNFLATLNSNTSVKPSSTRVRPGL